MLNAAQIIKEVNTLTSSNAGINGLVDANYCIMDEMGASCVYKEEGGCPDYKRCDDAEYMLACVQSRSPDQIADWAIEKYNAAMES